MPYPKAFGGHLPTTSVDHLWSHLVTVSAKRGRRQVGGGGDRRSIGVNCSVLHEVDKS